MSIKEELEKKKKTQKLKEKAEEVKKSAAQMQDESEERFKKSTGRNMTMQEKKDAWLENQTAKRYEDVGVSPIYARGNFNQYTPKNTAKTVALTQDESDRKNITEEYNKRRAEVKKKK